MIPEIAGAGSWLSFANSLSLFSFAVIFVLMVMSLISWGIILQKFFFLRKQQAQNDKFARSFGQKRQISELLALSQKHSGVINSELFQQVYSDFSSYRSKHSGGQDANLYDVGLLSSSMERGLSNYLLECTRRLEKGIPFLASVSSSAPFIGLLGTVLGITFSFQEIAAKGSTSLSVVAPGISEALVATALGLFVAIPALIAHNYYRSMIRNVTLDARIFGVKLIGKLIKAV